jgi:nitrate/nitrite transporter NarK
MFIPMILILNLSVFVFPTVSFIFYVIEGNQVFNFNLVNGYADKDSLGKEIDKQKRRQDAWIKNPTWCFEQYYHRFFGWFIASISYWLLINRITCFSLGAIELGWTDFLLFLISFVGLNGRLPTLAHSVETWLKRS